jgi:PAS domain S-box-containing protein
MAAASGDAAWFRARAKAAIHDFFEICEQNFEASEASARSLERLAGTLPGGGVEQQVIGARDRLRRARDGDWQPFEHHLRDLGSTYARAGLAFSAWYGIANSFYDTIVTRAVEAYAAEPSRLTGVLLVLGDYLERSLSIIATDYLAVKDRLEREVDLRHTKVLDAALDAVVGMDEDGVVTEFNRSAEHMFGYPRERAIGASLAALIIPERFRDAHHAAAARLLATGEARLMGRRVELCAMRADGSELPVELALVATAGLDGRQRFTGFLRDLTEQRTTEESLALRAHALEQAQFGIVISDPVTRVITNVNPAYARMTGYDPGELIGSRGDKLIAAASQSALPELYRTLQDHGHHTFELRLLRKDGTTLPILASSSSVVTRFGARMRVSTVIDISERDRLEQERAAATDALAHSVARLEILATTAHAFSEAAGDVRSLVDLVTRRLGEIIGEGCAVRLLSEDRQWLEPSASVFHSHPEHLELARQVLGTERQRIGDGIAGRVAEHGVAVLIPEVDLAQLLAATPVAFQALVARTRVTSILVIPLRSHGRTIGAINLVRCTPGRPFTVDDQRFAQDLADRAGLAIDNAALVATLEHRVAARTATLEAVNRELEAFSYSVSHDLRTPLRAIQAFSRMLAADHAASLDAHAQRYLSRICAATQRMSQLIDDLLGLAQLARVPLTVARVELSALAGEVIAEIQKREPDRHVRVHIAPGIVAHADARLLRIVFENLLGNAWKFTAKRPDAEISFGVDAGTFHVRDTGAGFDMAYADRLFVPFQRLHVAHDYDGTGVGLATVHRIVARHGGRIWAEAAIGQGATLYFTLGDGEPRPR